MANNYTLGRGELWFAPFRPGTRTARGESYFGNTPEFSLTIESENLDHYNSDRGVREKDQSIALQTDRTGNFTTDNISADNLALFFFGSKTRLTQAGGSVVGEDIEYVEKGLTYQLGMSQNNPGGARNISNLVLYSGTLTAATGTISFGGTGADNDTITIGDVTYKLVTTPSAAFDVKLGATAADTASNLAKAINLSGVAGTDYGTGTTVHPGVTATASTSTVTVTAKVGGLGGNSIALAKTGSNITVSGATLSGGAGNLVLGTDYEFDGEQGRVKILETSSITDGIDLKANYTASANIRNRIISGGSPIEGRLRFIAYNPVGENFNYIMPWVKIRPNGDYNLKGDDWQTIPFTCEILRLDGYEAVYIDGQPYNP